MNSTNWPGGVDRSHSNWTGRTQRSTEWGGNWQPGSYRIPPNVWIRVAAVLGLLLIVLPAIGAATGF